MNLDNHRLSLASIKEAVKLINAQFLDTPQYISKGLSDIFSNQLTVKVETINPIKSFKGRGAEVLVSKATKGKPIICASAGNFGQAMAFSCNNKGIDLTVFASENANQYKVEMMRSFGAKVILAGKDFDEAKTIAKQKSKESGARFVEDSQDIETLQGTGTIALELLKLPYTLDAILISLGNGALFSGIARVMKMLSPSTKLIAIQAKGAPAMIDSINAKKLISYDGVDTISDGIAIRLPVKQALIDLENLVDDTILVSDKATLKGMKLIHRHVGIVSEPSGAVGIAALLEHNDMFKGKKIATIICGGNLTNDQRKIWL